MGRYLVRRFIQTAIVILGAATVVFVLLRLSGDPIALLVPDDATPAMVQQIREYYGFNDPIYVQYARYLSRIAVGDFGTSIRFKRPAMELVLDRLPASLELAVVSLVLSVVLSLPLGILAAVKRGSLYDNFCTIASLLGQSVPAFWLGVILIILFAVQWRLFPTSGSGGWQHLVLPSVSLAVYFMARLTRVTRSCMLDVLGEDYIRTARAKGLGQMRVLYRHALRNASISVATVIGLTFASLICGSIITEVVFAWPGIGRLMVQAVVGRDYPVAQATVLVIAVFVAFTMLLLDLVYVYLDPRIKHTK
ncbi:Dipeptide transport system permease protein DppB [Anaerolineae bacterium]|nr:Dipeptide transport system permease protein DppB [Anaerolineae bacterium]